MNREQNGRDKHFIVKQSKIAYIVGSFIIGAAIGLAILEILYHVSDIPMWIYMVIAAIMLLGIYVCMEAGNRKLLVDNDTLYYCNVFRQMRSFSLYDIGYVEAAWDSGRGQDYLKIYDKEGKVLCKLECSMQNADNLLSYFYDNEVTVDMKCGKGQTLLDIAMQQPITREEMAKQAEITYNEVADKIRSWEQKNVKLGAKLYYGFALFRGNEIDTYTDIQRRESCCSIRKDEELPEDFLCVMEIFIKKEDYFVRDKKRNLLRMDFPVFYKRGTKAVGEDYRLYYNGSCLNEIGNALAALEKYLPGHRFTQEQMDIGYDLVDYKHLQ